MIRHVHSLHTNTLPQLLDYLLSQTPTAVAEVAELLEGLQKVAPQLFERLLTKAAPSLSPAKACETGDHAEVCLGPRGTFTELCFDIELVRVWSIRQMGFVKQAIKNVNLAMLYYQFLHDIKMRLGLTRSDSFAPGSEVAAVSERSERPPARLRRITSPMFRHR